MTSLIKILEYPNDTSLIIAVGISNISIFILPHFILKANYALKGKNEIIDCNILIDNNSSVYCYDSIK